MTGGLPDPVADRLAGARVLVTGHTGFKGAWLCAWLDLLGCEVHGVSDDVPTEPSLFEAAGVGARCAGDHRLDVAEAPALSRLITEVRPDLVVHLAAQSLVRASYRDPLGTWRTNVQGTAAVLAAVQAVGSVTATVVATSDKCYENDGRSDGYREGDRLGGHDPYSASKAAAELVVSSFRAADPALRVATVRAGNVIGGGDFAEDRLIPDLVRGAWSATPVRLRRPEAIRPWQDVRDCLAAYLWLLGELVVDPSLARGWNVGPDAGSLRTVAGLAASVAEHLPGLELTVEPGDEPVEAEVLTVDSTALRNRLGWRPRLDVDRSIADLTELYGAIHAGDDVSAAVSRQLRSRGQR